MSPWGMDKSATWARLDEERVREVAAEPIVISAQGSFFVGGRQLSGDGVYDPARDSFTNKGNDFWIDQMYVQYQIPVNPREYPLVLIHGGCCTGRVWESTPDGREGYQSIFLRHGFPVYIVDAPRRGRSGFPSFNGPIGNLNGEQVIATSRRVGLQQAWSLWRLGLRYPEVFEAQQFPIESVQTFVQNLVPDVADPTATIAALEELVRRIGPAILVTHSESGLYGWEVAARTRMVAGIVSYEPGFGLVFPESLLPKPESHYNGNLTTGRVISADAFDALASTPIQIVYGDNIPADPIDNIPADGRRVQRELAHKFAAALNGKGGKVEVLSLPDAGLFGNSHFMFSDKNNLEVAGQLLSFLSRVGAAERFHRD